MLKPLRSSSPQRTKLTDPGLKALFMKDKLGIYESIVQLSADATTF